MELNGSQAPLHAPDFNNAVNEARQSGDFDFVIKTAKETHRAMVDFRNAVAEAKFPGSQAACVAIGLNIISNFIAQADAQVQGFKRMEKETRDALNAQDRGRPEARPESSDGNPGEASNG